MRKSGLGGWRAGGAGGAGRASGAGVTGRIVGGVEYMVCSTIVGAQGKWAGRSGGDKRAGVWKWISERASGSKKASIWTPAAQRSNLVSEDFFAARRMAFAASPMLL